MKSPILDVQGHPYDLAAIREPQTARVAHLQREFDRHPARGITPARLHAIMVNAEQGDLVGQLELADDMEERDAHLYAELSKRRGALTSLAWSVEAPEHASAEEEKLTALVRDWLGMLTAEANGVRGGMELVLSSMTDAILKGFAPQEMVWAMQERVMLPHLTAQPQRWFTASADQRRFLLRSRATTEASDYLPSVQGEELQELSWLMHVHPARSGYVARMSLARVLFWPYLFKNYAVRDLAEFLEIYGLPLRLGKYPSGASDDEKRRLLQAVVQIGHNAAGIIPAGMELEFQAAAAGTEVPFVAMWDRLDAAESKAILGQTLSASEGQHGTQALGNVHNEVRMDIRAADARLIEGSVSRQLIRPLCILNVAGVNPLRLPRFKLDTGESEDLQVYAENLPKLAKAGLRIGVDWAQDKLRIPEPGEGEAIMTGGDTAPAVPADPAIPAKPAQAAKPTKAAPLAGQLPTGPQDLLDELVADAVRDWRPLMQPLVQPLLAELDQAVAAGESLASFAARLPELIDRMDSKPLAESIARAAFVASLAGEADLDLNHNEG
jgi:phage gp29-like protein